MSALPNIEQMALPLRKAIKVGADEVRELTLREPTVGELMQSEGEPTPMKQAARLIATVAAVPVSAVQNMSQRDFQDACDFFERFGRRTALATE